MSDCSDRNLIQNPFASPPDVSLMLRTHSEQSWLIHEVIPVVRQIETPEGLPEEQLPAAIAYLEVIWAEALGRARETDRALRLLDTLDLARHSLPARVCRYHAAVEALREATTRRVAKLIAAPPGAPVRELAPQERYAGRASSAWRR
jgi:hypothetical protein